IRAHPEYERIVSSDVAMPHDAMAIVDRGVAHVIRIERQRQTDVSQLNGIASLVPKLQGPSEAFAVQAIGLAHRHITYPTGPSGVAHVFDGNAHSVCRSHDLPGVVGPSRSDAAPFA